MAAQWLPLAAAGARWLFCAYGRLPFVTPTVGCRYAQATPRAPLFSNKGVATVETLLF